ncbi:MerR family transcriptional regulator [Apilactobacillus apisilvae]|uniref:MerR family transcriptional regulator n=1 Tax=Apilactobacillus apisilvae TaxID=2923364 RepID=A0ABY4PGE4_9LACO|nr:MerR family transcriptional regulator [Apilactobacillus apisilvae]UQS84881.1 MerR family transcriptional regulator [Apilactobacillus apisilvae]
MLLLYTNIDITKIYKLFFLLKKRFIKIRGSLHDRNDSGVRDIDERIIRRINFAKTMRAAGMSIESLLKYIQLFDSQEDNLEQQKDLLKQQVEIMREKRDDIQYAIDHLEFKIEHFDDHMFKSEEKLKKLEKNNM